MKNTALYILVLLIGTASCVEEEPFDTNTLKVGAVLQTVSKKDVTIDRNNPAGTTSEITIQFNDFGAHDSMKSVDIKVDFEDTTFDNEADKKEFDPVTFKTVGLSDFEKNENGLPQYTFKITGQELIDKLGIANAFIEPGDLGIILFDLTLNDGREFNHENVGVNVRTTSHVTPFRYTAPVICKFDEPNFATGKYIATTTIEGSEGVIFEGEVELQVGENNTMQRVFNAKWSNQGGGKDYTISLDCGKVIWVGEQKTGVNCESSTSQVGLVEPPRSESSTYDESYVDDQTIVLRMNEDASKCGGSLQLVEVRLTKV